MTQTDSPSSFKSRLISSWYFRAFVIVTVILLPVYASWVYSRMTAVPKTIRIATGPEDGRYRMIMDSIRVELENEYDIDVELVPTEGSFENLTLLKNQQVDLALFQSGSDRDPNLKQIAENRGSIRFIANVYPEVTQLLLSSRLDSILTADVSMERVALSLPKTADASIGEMLIDHLGLIRNGQPKNLAYSELPQAFADDQIDVAIVQVGVQAPIVRQLLESGDCRLVSIPNRSAFLAKHVAFSPATIPRGIYLSGKRNLPDDNIESVSVSAQMICHRQLHSELARGIAEIIHRPDFAKRNELQQLFANGTRFSNAKAEFTLHRGAQRFYDPSLQPWINSEFVEATEGIRSFFVSILIAGFFLIRWLTNWRTRSVEHRLDRYIHRLLDIEHQQMELDFKTDDDSVMRLEKLLDEVTLLRREALTEFTAHQLNDDPAIPCFLDMSHALSEKISSKLTRGRIGRLATENKKTPSA